MAQSVTPSRSHAVALFIKIYQNRKVDANAKLKSSTLKGFVV